MPNSHSELYFHCVWTTWDRESFLTKEVKKRIRSVMAAKCAELKCHLMACDGAADHLHLLARLPATLCVADIMHYIKGASGHFATHELNLKDFRWSSSYYSVSVSPESLDKVRDYIDNQEQRHANREVLSNWERSSDAAAG